MSLVDKTLTCRDCGKTFVFSVGEQEFFQAKGLLNEPGRCSECRATAKKKAGVPVRDKPQRELYAAVCAQCGGPAMVPFQPRLDRPVYCSSCYDKVKAASVAAEVATPVSIS